MKKAIAIGLLGLALTSSGAAAQTAVEQSQILRDFERTVVEYTQRHKCFDMFPEALSTATPAPKIFTLPVAMVFRQLIAHTLADRAPVAIGGIGTPHRAVVLQPFPSDALNDFPALLRETLPPLAGTLEYRLIGDDLVIRDTAADVIVAVLRDAVGHASTVRR